MMNVFVKPEGQNDACISYALARKGRMKSNYELKKYVPILKKWDFAFFLVTMNYEL